MGWHQGRARTGGKAQDGDTDTGACAGGGRGNSLSVVSQKLLSQEQAGLLVSGSEGHYFRGVFSDVGMLLTCYMKKAGHNDSYSLVNMYILIIHTRRNARMKTVSVILSLSGGVYKKFFFFGGLALFSNTQL